MSQLSILCAFANSALRTNVAKGLESSSFKLLHATTAPDVIDSVTRHTPDLLLCDSKLVGADDLPLLEAVRSSSASGAAIPAILLTGKAPSAQLEQAAENLAARVVSARSIRAKQLCELIEHELDPDAKPSEGDLLSLFERVRSTNPFAALGVSSDAEPCQIKRAYLGLARRMHPDALAESAEEIRQLSEEAFSALAAAYKKLSDPDELAAYRKNPDRDQEQAAAKQEVRQVIEAERMFKEAEAKLTAQDWCGALRGYQRATELCPEEGEYLACLAWATYLVEGAAPEALAVTIRQAQAAVKLSPKHSRVALILGRLYQAAEKLDAATNMFKRAVRLDPHSVEAVRELRIMRMREERARKQNGGLLKKFLGR